VLVSVPFFVLAQMPPFPVVVGALAFAGLAAGPLNPLLMTVIQERVPSAMRGRVFGMITASALVAAPLGMVLAGLVVEAAGVRWTLLGMGLCYLAVTGSQVFNRNLRELSIVSAPSQSS
jgi:MFS family permease